MFAFRASIGRSIAALLGGNNVKLFSNQLRQAPVAPRSDIVSISVPELQSRRGFCDGFLHKRPENRNIRDHKRRLLAAKYELRRKLYKALTNDPELPPEIREKHRYKLSKLPRNSAFSRLRNRCIFTGRPRAVYEKFRMSRIVFRELASRGMLMGVKKASW